jgi:hypothetical protein
MPNKVIQTASAPVFVAVTNVKLGIPLFMACAHRNAWDGNRPGGFWIGSCEYSNGE